MKHSGRYRIATLLLASVCIAGSMGVSSRPRKNEPARAEDAASSSADGLLARFPFVFDGRILIPIRINDAQPLNIILDTGYNQGALLLMHKETGDDLGLAYVRTVAAIRGAGSGENKNVHVTAGERLSLPGLDLGKFTTAVMDESRAVSLQHNQGVIGTPLFIRYVVEIDFDRLQISLYDSASFSPREGWQEIPLGFAKNLPIVETKLRLGEGDPVPVRLVVDTGGKAGLALAINKDRKIDPPARTVHFLSGTGFRGDVFAEHGRVPELVFGGQTLKNVVTAFWTGNEAPVLSETNTDGLLGAGSLYRFNMMFDYTRRRMFIKPSRFFSDPFELNMAGMALEETVSGDMAVYYVMEGSEAAKKGLQKGDVLVEASGKEVRAYGFPELKRLFERAGKTVSVKVRRSGEVREIKLTLQRII